ncbi:MAG: CYTH domain-containing protein [Pseudomonadota bacterium]
MGQEIEIKLTIDAAQLDRILAHPLVVRYSGGTRLHLELFNTYYDTPALELYHHRMALRVRREGDRFVQTVKTRGESRNGLSRRGEWEWPLPDEVLQPGLVPRELWPPGMEERLQGITPVFTTDFNRTLCRVTLPENLFSPGQPAACLELALDRGRVSAIRPKGPSSEAISEIEMELIYGEIVTLQAFSLSVSDGLPVFPCDVSKAERGYRLLDRETLLTAPD